MTTEELVKEISFETGVAPLTTNLVVSQLLKTITAKLAKYQKIELTDFGDFDVTFSTPNVGINQKTGERMVNSAHAVLRFKPSSALKKAIPDPKPEKKAKK